MDVIGKIEKFKKQKGWSTYQLSIESGIAQSTLATMKQRKTPIKIDALESICEALGITMAQFFLEDEEVELLSAQEKELLKKFRRLTPKQKEGLLNLLLSTQN